MKSIFARFLRPVSFRTGRVWERQTEPFATLQGTSLIGGWGSEGDLSDASPVHGWAKSSSYWAVAWGAQRGQPACSLL